ncbi:hypothetical protein VE04_08239, partial [Pseudogymnoascus sp. 24MN13]
MQYPNCTIYNSFFASAFSVLAGMLAFSPPAFIGTAVFFTFCCPFPAFIAITNPTTATTASLTSTRPRTRPQPLSIIRDPALRKPEHGLLGVPELDEHAEAICAEPAQGRDDAGEFGFVAVERGL